MNGVGCWLCASQPPQSVRTSPGRSWCQGLRSRAEWGLWTIHPDGTNWNPLVSAFLPGGGAPDSFHFQTQLSDGHIVVERYYLQNNFGFGLYYKLPPRPPAGTPAFGPADPTDPRNPPEDPAQRQKSPRIQKTPAEAALPG